MIAILNPLEASYYYDQFQYVWQNPSFTHKVKLFKLNVAFVSLLNTLTEDREQQTFISNYAKIHFVAEAYNLSDLERKELYYARRLLKENLSRQNFDPSRKEVEFLVRVLVDFVEKFSDTPLPTVFQQLFVALTDLDQQYVPLETLTQQLKATYLAKTEMPEDGVLLYLLSDELGEFEVVVRDVQFSPYHKIRLTANCTFLSKNQTLLFVNLEYIEGKRWATTEESLIVIEPDYLVDASALARCFSPRYNSAYFNLLNRLEIFQGNKFTLGGTLINEILDHLFQEPELSFEEGWLYALEKHKVEAAQLSPPELQSIKQDLVAQFGTLRKVFQERSSEERLIAEPTFISSVYGLQGRLDVLKEFSQQPKRKEIIELKAKKSFPEVQRIGWPNDLIQIACYNLLLDSTFEGRRGTSSLLYSKDQANPLRDCGRLNYEKQQAMQMRNRLVRLDWEVSKGNSRIFNNLANNLFDKGLPKFTEEKVEAFRQVWQQANEAERSYFVEYFGLVMREQIVAKVGGISGIEPSEGFASLWKSSDEEKRDAFTLLDELQVLTFDAEARRLYLQRPEKSVSVTAFREGDIIVLYPRSAAAPVSVALLKGNIVALNNETLTLQLWTTYLDETLFSNSQVRWAIEPNLMEKGYLHQTASLAEFLRADRRKKDLLLGTLRPTFDHTFTLAHRPDLNEEQNQILRKALSARDYFLLQGPPGTGKTSRMLKSMVEEMYQGSRETIVLLAFTNRATDEICEKVKQVCQDNFIRFGQLSAESAYYAQSLHSSQTLKEIRERLDNTRVFVSTVASFLSSFHYLKRFDTLIVDEASQLLEPHLCGIIPRFKRFFLIGDEKQLPAVVTQPQRFCHTKNEALNHIGITDLGQSVFDRLIANAKAKDWNDCYAMLSYQFRTHEVIARFFNDQFYKSLQVGSDRQKAAWDWFDPESEDANERFLAKGRLLFISTAQEVESKFNRAEAIKVVELVQTIARVLRARGRFSEESIGVITPYRAQIAEITRLLPADLQQKVTIDTVERYQGSERDVIILSMSLNYPAMLQNLQSFNADKSVDRKLNVALSRTREQLVLLGNEAILRKGKFYERLLDYIGS